MQTERYSVNDLDFTPNHSLHPSPIDWRDQFIYFLLVDRFNDGDTQTEAYLPQDESTERDISEGRKFQGGKIKGITQRLSYIKNLGCTTVWLSPIFKNNIDQSDSYHGYGIQNFLDVDSRFGTMEDLQELTREAHALDMYVVLDIIFNHTGDVWAYPEGHPYYYADGQQFPFGYWREHDPAEGMQIDDAVWPVELQDPNVFKRKGEIRNWGRTDEMRDGDFLSLKEIDINQPKVLDALIKSYKAWILNTDVDGFRIDTVKHMEHTAVAVFCNAIREYAQRIGKHNFFMFGEIVGDDAEIQKYIGRNVRFENTHERFPSLDAGLDFPLYFMLEDVIKGFTSPAVLRGRYDNFHQFYADHGEAGRYFVTFIDNHDQMSRPYRRFMHNNPYPQQAVLAMAYLLTSQGVPCIYYGTEQGFDGGGDNDSYVRECMFGGTWGAFESQGKHFFNEFNEIYHGINSLAIIRKQEATLRYGRQYFREISTDAEAFYHPDNGECTLAFSRILDTEEVLVCLNLSNQSRSDFVTVDNHLSSPGTPMRNLLRPNMTYDILQRENKRVYVQVELPAHGVAILKC